MINYDSLNVTSSLSYGPQFIRPAYGSYCFAHIPDTIRKIFNLTSTNPLPYQALPAWQNYKHVVFFFIDGFGWQLFEKYVDHFPFLKEMLQGGIISRFTSMFPSTTAAHTTCIHTGLDVASSGVYEWFYFEPHVDEVISPLLFSIAGEKQREQLAQNGVKADSVFPISTFYQDLVTAGVKSYVFNNLEYAYSTFSKHVTHGAKTMPFLTFSEALVNLKILLEAEPGPLYCFLYFSTIDAIGHHYGPQSIQFEAEITTWLEQMDRFLSSILKSKNTIILISADHGQAEVNPKTTLYINWHLRNFERYFTKNKIGKPILFGGSPRDLFLYIREENLKECHEILSQTLGSLGEVHFTTHLFADGLFGNGQENYRLRERVGNLVILPYNHQSVGWYVAGRFEQKYYGHHGGLTPEEMFVPFIAYPID